ncbi:MAG: MFS transporter [Chloroflexota bacterium]|nr:MFS transporter [Chloroflexota bacterium]
MNAPYAKINYQISESLYGLIPTTNALMAVFLQIYVTKKSKRHPPLWVMTLGGFLYGLGVVSIALGNGFWGFWISMVIVTAGELMIVPTAITFTANLASEDMRGRYMSMFALTWGLGTLMRKWWWWRGKNVGTRMARINAD